MSVGFAVSLVPCSSYGACGFAQLLLPPVTLRGSCVFSAYFCLPDCCAGGVGWAAALPLRSQCFSCGGWLADGRWVLHPVWGSPIDVVTALCMAVWWCLTAPRAFGLCLWFCHPHLRFSASVGASGWVCFWPAVSGAHVSCEVCAVSAALRGWSSFCCVGLSFTCSCGTGCLVAVFWPFLLLLWVELSWGLCCGLLSPWPLVAPSPSVVSRLGSSFGVCSGLGWKAAVLSWILPSFGRGSPSLVLVVFAWLFRLFCCSGSLSFLNSLLGFLSSCFPCLLIARYGWWLVLGYPPSVAWLREVLPCFSGPNGAAVPLGSSVLRGSGSLQWGHLSPVGTVSFLSSRL